MEYRVEQLAQVTNLSVDTIRFYQGKGLLPPPRRRGRCVYYSDTHLERLQTIRKLGDQGFSLALIKRALAPLPLPTEDTPRSAADTKLLAALVEESFGTETENHVDAAQTEIPESFIATACAAGLVQPIEEGGQARFTNSDLELLRTGYSIVHAGLPVDDFLNLAREHARDTQRIADKAIALFDRHLRKRDGAPNETEATATAFRALLPQVTSLVARYFQRTLVNRALQRFAEKTQALDGAPADAHQRGFSPLEPR
jgi:DNA-binding transcriptional MerR regulator